MNYIQRKLTLTITLLILAVGINAQNAAPDSLTNTPPENYTAANNDYAEPEQSTETLALPLSRLEFQLSLWILGFGALLILFEVYLIKIKNIDAGDTIKFITVTIIIISTLFLITAGYSNDQIAPAVGLLGTIAGYLLGRFNSPSNKNDHEKV